MWRACVLGPVWHMVWKQRIVTFLFPWPRRPVGPGKPPAVFWPVVDLSCWAWQALSHHCFLMNQSFQNDSCISLCFFFRDIAFDIAFVLAHLLDSLVMYQVTLTESMQVWLSMTLFWNLVSCFPRRHFKTSQSCDTKPVPKAKQHNYAAFWVGLFSPRKQRKIQMRK